ncbi:hypothetical protein AN189_18500 [Loktanella sp. 3ANDIMAR09]|uniref:tail protein X n=1 Tax=Loktanella sp. 3ANDIMAR09 TaxID=1225657 RepID=UPI0006FEBF37|nr:tail protein X [Loktanella sp. 3ANDIMAR09]KQI66880.1 hypothetical protein AN189_18500 [Loktanella sp. 3ANDIMAR09]
MTPYLTRQGDVVDLIAHRELGDARLCTAILDANPGLAAAGAVLPDGLLIMLPDAAPAPTRTTIRLWGRT